MHSYRGFTLIEVAVVIAIIAIIAAMALPRLTDLGDEAERAAVKDYLQKLRSAYSLYTAANTGPPQTFDDFVSQTPLANDGPQTLSVANMGRGGCKVQGNQIQCRPEDFPKLYQNLNLQITYTLENRVITVNLPPS